MGRRLVGDGGVRLALAIRGELLAVDEDALLVAAVRGWHISYGMLVMAY